jgi:hypothetical protein
LIEFLPFSAILLTFLQCPMSDMELERKFL